MTHQEGPLKETGTQVIDISLLIPFSSPENLISYNSVWDACQHVPQIPKGGWEWRVDVDSAGQSWQTSHLAASFVVVCIFTYLKNLVK